MSDLDNDQDDWDQDDKEFDSDPDDNIDDWDEDWECAFPGECCMCGEHMRSECYTAEMVEVYESDGESFSEQRERHRKEKIAVVATSIIIICGFLALLVIIGLVERFFL